MTDKGSQNIPAAVRPTMKHYGVAKGRKGLLDWSFVDERMSRSRNYWISTTRADGRPHAAPVWGVWVDGVLYFSTGGKSVKGRNLALRPEVSVHLESGDEVVIIEGRIEPISSGAELDKASQQYKAKYPPFELKADNPPTAAIYRVMPREVFAWTEKDFPNTATRWVFE